MASRRAAYSAPAGPQSRARRSCVRGSDGARSDRGFAMRLLTLALLLAVPLAADEPYDLVIRHARVVDGTGNPWVYADVAVRGDKIVAVGRVTGTGKREIDAKGLVVAPGFIDMHSH